jgi:hypothetical protein
VFACSFDGHDLEMRFTTTLVAAALLFPAAASAAGGAAALVKDCQDEKIDGTYSAQEYRDALRSLPTDVDEYTGCRATLRSAQLRAAASPRSAPAAGSTAGAGLPAGVRAAMSGQGLADQTPAEGSRRRAALQSVAPSSPAQPSAAAAAAASAPRIPGLPESSLPVGDAAPPVTTPGVPVASVAGATDDVPPTVAGILVVLAAGALAAAAGIRRRHA